MMNTDSHTPMRTLLFEDDDQLRLVLHRMCTRRGWKIRSFQNALACPLACSSKCTCPLPEFCANVIVTDFEMPGLDGVSFVSQLRDKGCRISNIAVFSGSCDDDALACASDLGIRVFAKPDGILALLDLLETVASQVADDCMPALCCE